VWLSQVEKSIAELVEGPHKTACLKTKMDINRTVQQIAGTLETVTLFHHSHIEHRANLPGVSIA
jgi:hypothetical protein